MLPRTWSTICIIVLLTSGCSQASPSPVPTVIAQNLPPTTTSIPRPTATRTPTPRPTLRPVNYLTQQAEDRQDFYTLTPTHTPIPTPTNTSTPTPVPVLTAHRWTAKPVLIQFGHYGGDGGPELPKNLPGLVLYANGRLLMMSWEWSDAFGHQGGQLWEKNLTQHEVCTLLNTIDQTGFYDYDASSYLPKGKEFPIDGAGTVGIQIDAWRSQHVALYGLWDFVVRDPPLSWTVEDCSPWCAPPPTIPSSLREIYRLFLHYKPTNLHLYKPDRLAVWIRLLEKPETNLAKPWPLPSFSLKNMYAYAKDKGIFGKSTMIKGTDAVSIYQVFDNAMSDERTFTEQGLSYGIFVRPLFPYEEMPDSQGDAGKIQDSNISGVSITLRCTPSDGVLEIP